jgi:uncharacterized protein YndB with AHSA1/START domain
MTQIQAKAEMLIRKPVAEVFEAFTNPEFTTKFWFTKSSGKLEAGKQVQWEWEMYGAAAQVDVQALEANKRILIKWVDASDTVEWTFTARPDNTTFVSIVNTGFSGDDVVKQALDATEAFTLVLAGCKALLEHNIRLNLVADRFPKGLEQS